MLIFGERLSSKINLGLRRFYHPANRMSAPGHLSACVRLCVQDVLVVLCHAQLCYHECVLSGGWRVVEWAAGCLWRVA